MLKEKLGVEAQLIKGSNGIFEVAVDGNVVVAKSRGGFPTEDSVVAAVKAVNGG